MSWPFYSGVLVSPTHVKVAIVQADSRAEAYRMLANEALDLQLSPGSLEDHMVDLVGSVLTEGQTFRVSPFEATTHLWASTLVEYRCKEGVECEAE